MSHHRATPEPPTGIRQTTIGTQIIRLIFSIIYINIFMLWIKIYFYRLIWLNENIYIVVIFRTRQIPKNIFSDIFWQKTFYTKTIMFFFRKITVNIPSALTKGVNSADYNQPGTRNQEPTGSG